jgi:hypothetical protein
MIVRSASDGNIQDRSRKHCYRREREVSDRGGNVHRAAAIERHDQTWACTRIFRLATESEEVFGRRHGAYLWTNVRLFGTIDDPGQDLSPRIIELLKQSPGAYLQLLFRQFEGWLKKGFGGD